MPTSETRLTMSTPEEQMAAAVRRFVRATSAARDDGNDPPSREMTLKDKIRVPRRPPHKQPRVVDTRVIGRPDEFDGDPMKHNGLVVQTESILRSCGPAVSAGVEDDKSIVNTETRREAQLRGELPQHTDVLHTRDDNDRIGIGQVSRCRHERGIRGQETVRDGVGNGVCWTPDERATDKVGNVGKTRARESIVGNC